MELLEDYLISSADRDSVLKDLDSLWRLPIFDTVSAEGCLPEIERNLSLAEQIPVLQETSGLTFARLADADAGVLRDEGTETPPISSDSESSEFPLLKGPTPYLKRATPIGPLRMSFLLEEELSSIDEKPKASKVIVPLKNPSALSARHRITSMPPFRRVRLSEEEKSLLVQEGLPIPTRYPLSVMDENNLKSIRRKLKNKISAQESRRKKKEYMETLEDQIKALENENVSLKDRLAVYSKTSQLLFNEVKKIKTLIGGRKTEH